MVTVTPFVDGTLGMVPKVLEERLGGIGNQRKNQDHPHYSMAEINQNNRKSLGELRKIAISQTLVKDHLRSWCEKFSRSDINNPTNYCKRTGATPWKGDQLGIVRKN